jgi:hypothetical protein
VRAAARANDPRLSTMREFAGTEDGVHVVTFYAQGGADKTPFDSSHLDHCHGSLWRDTNENDHQGIVDVMLGVPTGENEDEMSFANIEIKLAETSITVPGGTYGGGSKPTYLAFCNDTGHGEATAPKYALRVYTTKGGKDDNWTPIISGATSATPFVIFESGKVRSFVLPNDTRSISIVRMAIDETGKVVAPTEAMPAYAGDLSCAIER